MDTGFTDFLALPFTIVVELGLPLRSRRILRMADGSLSSMDVYDAVLLWHGQSYIVETVATDKMALIGMSLLEGSKVLLDVKEGGTVEIWPAEEGDGR